MLITAGAIYLASRGTHHRLHALINATLHTSGQFAVRLVMLLLTSLVALSLALDLDMLLGAFAAGVIAKLLLADATPRDARDHRGASSRRSGSASSCRSSSSTPASPSTCRRC